MPQFEQRAAEEKVISARFSSVVPPPPLRTGPQPDQRSPRRPRGLRLRVFPLVLIVSFGSFMFWASRQEGGISGTFETFADWVNGQLEDVTGSGDIEAAVEYFNEEYAQSGDYDRLTETQMHSAPVDLSGIEYQWCTPQLSVVRAFTARGTVSYLLVAGESWGKATGDHGCPVDLFDPVPWSLPQADSVDA